MTRRDPHSYADDAQPRTKSLALALDVDFDRRVLDGVATLHLDGPRGGPLDLDTRGLAIRSVTTLGGAPLPFQLFDEEPILGRRLRVELPAGTAALRVAYETAPDASALQWLAPEQTAGKRHPFLFSQCQAIHARSLAPLQDTPSIRIRYEAAVTVPAALTAVMSAGPAGTRPGPRAGTRTFLFEMPQPIAPYLLALAVGDLEGRDVSPRARVWAEPATVGAAAWEFEQIERFIVTAESLFGPYDWDRFDMLVLPPSFPYGGMENPRMTFLTPTLLAGDRSLVDVVAHELAHSWTGNLVTNANAEHFWLNEGFTVWAERRILEAQDGPEKAALSWAIGQKALEGALARFGADSPFTRLRMELTGVDPDDVFSPVPYEKGSRLVALLERTVGRSRWDAFMRDYMSAHRFGALTSEEFRAFLDAKLPGASDAVRIDDWLYQPSLPENAPAFRSPRLDALTALAAGFVSGARPSARDVASWPPTELVVYLQNLPRALDGASCQSLDEAFGLTKRGNYEILVEWLTIAAGSDYEPAFARIREVLLTVGRMKYLRPLYTALGKHARTRALAREAFAAAAPTYHSLSRRVAQSILEKYEPD